MFSSQLNEYHYTSVSNHSPLTTSVTASTVKHNLVRATVIPEIVKIICHYYGIDEDEALKRFYESATGANFADEETGLYGHADAELHHQLKPDSGGEVIQRLVPPPFAKSDLRPRGGVSQDF